MQRVPHSHCPLSCIISEQARQPSALLAWPKAVFRMRRTSAGNSRSGVRYAYHVSYRNCSRLTDKHGECRANPQQQQAFACEGCWRCKQYCQPRAQPLSVSSSVKTRPCRAYSMAHGLPCWAWLDISRQARSGRRQRTSCTMLPAKRAHASSTTGARTNLRQASGLEEFGGMPNVGAGVVGGASRRQAIGGARAAWAAWARCRRSSAASRNLTVTTASSASGRLPTSEALVSGGQGAWGVAIVCSAGAQPTGLTTRAA